MDIADVNWRIPRTRPAWESPRRYTSADLTDFGFYLNHGTQPPFVGDLALQMEVSGMAAPELSTWAMMLAGCAGLGLCGVPPSNSAGFSGSLNSAFVVPRRQVTAGTPCG